ncbi:MAG: flagellar hook-basal body complex protein FliE [Halieaceae bacterium]|jgi:flagellar hook-basal body complex protein FliE|nr:flagellar hook-basal body complex protein FliE [Halieaceae bacterium]
MSDVAINQVLAQMRVMAAQAGIETAPADNAAAPKVNFSELMQDSIEDVNAAMMESKALRTSFEMGDPQVSLTEVMVASQRAGIQFQAMTEVRNKLLTAYQEVMSMQV